MPEFDLSSFLHPGSRPGALPTGPGPYYTLAGQTDVLHPDAVLTTAIRRGTPSRRGFGTRVLPDVARTEWKIRIINEDGSHLLVHNTERGYGEVIKSAQFIASTETHEMTRRSFRYGLDQGRLRSTRPEFNLVTGSIERARWAVELDEEYARALLIGTPTNYPAAHRFDESGTPWNAAGGDAKARLAAGATQILSAHTGYNFSDFDITMTLSAWDAVRADATWSAKTNGVHSQGLEPGLDDFRRYLYGDGSNATISVEDTVIVVDGALVSMYGELLIQQLNTGAPSVERPFGQDVFGANWVLGQGAALQPFYQPETTTWWYPYERWSLPTVMDFTTASIHYDMKA